VAKAIVRRTAKRGVSELTPAGEVICPDGHHIFDEHMGGSTAPGLNETQFAEAIVELTYFKLVEGCVIPVVDQTCPVNKARLPLLPSKLFWLTLLIVFSKKHGSGLFWPHLARLSFQSLGFV